MTEIFGTILDSFFNTWPFSDDIKKLTDDLTQASLNIYSQMLTKILPTPTKPFYTFNLRDVSKGAKEPLKRKFVFQ